MKPTFSITVVVWLLLQACGVYAQAPGAAIDARLDAQSVEILAVSAKVGALEAAMPKPTSIIVRWTGQDQSDELQSAINEAAKQGLWLDTPDGKEYIVSKELVIPSVFGFGWRSAPPSVGGTVHPNQRGCGFALTWKGPDSGCVVKCLAANASLQLHIKGREKDTDPVPQNLVGLSIEKTVVASGKSDLWLRFDDLAVGLRCGTPGDVQGHHCDTLRLRSFEAMGCKSAWETNNEQGMGFVVEYARINCERFIDVWAGGKITVLKASILGPCKVLTIRAETPERPVSVGSGNGIFTFLGVEADAQTEGQLQLLDMERDAGLVATFENVILPKGSALLVDSKGGANVTISGRNISAGSIRMTGVQRKNPTTGLKEWIQPYTVVENAKIGGVSGAALLTADSTKCTLEWDELTGGFKNERIEPGFETRN